MKIKTFVVFLGVIVLVTASATTFCQDKLSINRRVVKAEGQVEEVIYEPDGVRYTMNGNPCVDFDSIADFWATEYMINKRLNKALNECRRDFDSDCKPVCRCEYLEKHSKASSGRIRGYENKLDELLDRCKEPRDDPRLKFKR